MIKSQVNCFFNLIVYISTVTGTYILSSINEYNRFTTDLQPLYSSTGVSKYIQLKMKGKILLEPSSIALVDSN